MTVGKDVILQALHKAKNVRTAFVARDLGIPERDIFRALSQEECTELDASLLPKIIRELEVCKTVFLVVKSAGAVLCVESSISGKPSPRGYYNVFGEPAHMLIMPDAIDSAFAVHREPDSQTPRKFSIQFYDCDGKPALKIFLTQDKDAEGYREADMEAFEKIRRMYRKEGAR